MQVILNECQHDHVGFECIYVFLHRQIHLSDAVRCHRQVKDIEPAVGTGQQLWPHVGIINIIAESE